MHGYCRHAAIAVYIAISRLHIILYIYYVYVCIYVAIAGIYMYYSSLLFYKVHSL